MNKLATQSMLMGIPFRKVNKPVRRANKPAKKANKPAKRANNNVIKDIQHVDNTPVPVPVPVPTQTLDNLHSVKTAMIIKNPVIIH